MENVMPDNPKKKSTTADVAREAGVGTTSVTRYFHPRKRLELTPQTRFLIECAVQKLRYSPRPYAREKKVQQYTFGLLTSLSKDIFNSRYHTGILSGIFDRIGKTTHELKLILLKNRHYERVEEILYDHGIDGLMILTWRIHPNVVKLVEESTGELPLVIFNDYDPKLRVNILYTDVREGMKKAVFHLFERGHREIGMLSGPTDILFKDGDKMLQVPSIDVREKRQGYIDAFEERGIKVLPDWIHECHSYTSGDGYAIMREWIKNGNLPQAVVCANDEIALGALTALKEAKIACPEGLALIGFDDIEKAGLVSPSLTTVRQPLYQMGVDAVEVLIDRVKFPTKDAVQKSYLPELIPRQTA